jgi:hypothetical protein
MPKEPLNLSWVVQNGNSLSDSETTSPQKGASITVHEAAQSFNMGGDNAEMAGQPVTAQLAVALIADFQKLLQKTANLGDGSANELAQLLQKSSAITIDKSMLLKTLSQPGCEGIRFYLCKKTLDQKDEYASLVTVGVDAKGKDLYYDYNDAVGQFISTNGIRQAQVENVSLVGEYGSPPPPRTGGGGGGGGLNGFGDEFVLLRYALNQK